MKMRSKVVLAGALLSTAPAMADTLPTICNSAINYAVQSLDLGLSDGAVADPYDPTSIRLVKSLNQYPISNVKYLGGCDAPQVKKAWCRVAGGEPAVFQADVSEAYMKDPKIPGTGGTYPIATVVVTYNRGGCFLDLVEKK